MKALCKLSPKANDVGLIDIPMPEMRPNEVLVRAPGCGICVGDLDDAWRREFSSPEDAELKYPWVLGNECYGVVEEVGDNVTRWKVGDRVISEHRIGCGECMYCRTGQDNLCPGALRYGRSGFRTGGTMAEYFATPSTHVHKIPDNVSGLAASLTEKLAVACEGIIVQGGGIRPGDTAVIIGPGPVGQCASQLLQLSGALNVIVIGLSKDTYRLELAEKLGATRSINVEEDDPLKAVSDLTEGRMADFVLLTVSPVSPAAEKQAISLARSGGHLAIIGVDAGQERPGPGLGAAAFREITVTGCNAHAWKAYDYAMKIFATGKGRFEQIITVKLPYEQWEKGLLMQETREAPFVQGFLYWEHMDWEMPAPNP